MTGQPAITHLPPELVVLVYMFRLGCVLLAVIIIMVIQLLIQRECGFT